MWDYPELLRTELRRGEQLIWSGQPRPGFRLQRSDLVMIPFSLFFFGFSVFWILAASAATHGLSPFSLFGLPFLLVGAYQLVGRFFFDAYRRRHTFYGLTNQRLLIASEVFGRKITAVSLRGLATLVLELSGDGYGTISVGGPASLPSNWTSFSSNRTTPLLPTLEQVERAQEVYDKIQDAATALEREERQLSS